MGSALCCERCAIASSLRSSRLPSSHAAAVLRSRVARASRQVPARTAGQSCLDVSPCAAGLYCDIPDARKAGSCKALPTLCNGDLCGGGGCLTALLQCSGTPQCVAGNDGAFIKCKQ